MLVGMSDVLVGPQDSEVSVKAGDVVVVRLPELSAAGYQWRVSALDPPGLPVESAQETAEGMAPGSAGVKEFRLRPPAPGRVRVEFELARPWDPTPEKHHLLTITVN
jgi:predicted secreted protein